MDVIYGQTKTSDVYSYEINPFNKTATYPEMGTDTYSTVGFDLELKRHYTKHFLNFYIMRCQAWSRGKSRALIKPASSIIQTRQIKETPAIGAQQVIQNYSQLDMIFLPCFPLLFLLFNLIYWPIIATETLLSIHQ